LADISCVASGRAELATFARAQVGADNTRGEWSDVSAIALELGLGQETCKLRSAANWRNPNAINARCPVRKSRWRLGIRAAPAVLSSNVRREPLSSAFGEASHEEASRMASDAGADKPISRLKFNRARK